MRRNYRAGTIFLVQGAPGAGKTALLAECPRRTESEGWQIARVNSDTLWNPDTLVDELKPRQKYQPKEKSLQPGSSQVAHYETIKTPRSQTTVKLLKRSRRENCSSFWTRHRKLALAKCEMRRRPGLYARG